MYATGQNTFFGRAAALISSTRSVANLQRVMTYIGAVCLITIGVWCAIELPVQFENYHHNCKIGEGEHCLFRPRSPKSLHWAAYPMPTAMYALSHSGLTLRQFPAYKYASRADQLLLLPALRLFDLDGASYRLRLHAVQRAAPP